MIEHSENGFVKATENDGLGEITFGHPKSNSLPGELLLKLAQTITDFGKNERVKIILLKSYGSKAFCAGASFDELLSISDFKTGKRFFMGFANVINAMRKCPKFIIARVQGKTVGGGVGIASAADYTIATINADIKLSELAVGIGPFVVGPAVERKIGTASAYELAINAHSWRSAAWANQHGLFAEIFQDIESMDESIQKLIGKLLSYNPEAMKEIKEAFWRGTENWDKLLESRAEQSGRLVMSEFTRNAINAFKSK